MAKSTSSAPPAPTAAPSPAASASAASPPAPTAPYSFAIDLNVHGESFKRGHDVPLKSKSHPWCTEKWCKEAAEFGHVVRNQSA